MIAFYGFIIENKQQFVDELQKLYDSSEDPWFDDWKDGCRIGRISMYDDPINGTEFYVEVDTNSLRYEHCEYYARIPDKIDSLWNFTIKKYCIINNIEIPKDEDIGWHAAK